MNADERDRLMREYAPRLLAGTMTTDHLGLTVVHPVDDDTEPLTSPDANDDIDLLDPEDEPEVRPESDPDDDGDDDASPEGDTDQDDGDPAQDDGPDAEPDEDPDDKPAPSKPLQRAYARARELVVRDDAVSTPGSDGIWKPVITTARGRTFLTAPATVERAAMWDEVPNPNPHLMWMQGRFVGGDRPNRNNAYWSAQDLEMGKPTVTHGPLNWLHKDTHVIGTIADAKFVPRGGGGGLDLQSGLNGGVRNEAVETAAETQDSHIVALSAIWRWIYPQEASVVQMASDAGVLAYSMECISEAVQCVRNEEADLGCGEAFPYMAYAQGQMCDHLKERATVRRLVNPTFLGGAVIVPPSRPGWADADARVMAMASKVAEKAYDQAGRPDIPANTWEALMAGVVKFAEGTP